MPRPRAIQRIGNGGEIREHRIACVVLHFAAMGFDGFREEIQVAGNPKRRTVANSKLDRDDLGWLLPAFAVSWYCI